MRIESLSYSIKNKLILKDIHLELQKGEIGFLFGRNGSGKTTLLNLIAGVLNPTAGNIQLSEEPVSSKPIFYLPAFALFR